MVTTVVRPRTAEARVSHEMSTDMNNQTHYNSDWLGFLTLAP